MGLITGIVVYVVIWFIVLFTVLPWGVRIPDAPEKGHAPSAPTNPRLGLKVAVTSAIAGVLWAGVYLAIESGLVTLRPPVP